MATNTEKIVVQVVVKGGKQLDNLGEKTGKEHSRILNFRWLKLKQQLVLLIRILKN
jgi:hypothetical protein